MLDKLAPKVEVPVAGVDENRDVCGFACWEPKRPVEAVVLPKLDPNPPKPVDGCVVVAVAGWVAAKPPKPVEVAGAVEVAVWPNREVPVVPVVA